MLGLELTLGGHMLLCNNDSTHSREWTIAINAIDLMLNSNHVLWTTVAQMRMDVTAQVHL